MESKMLTEHDQRHAGKCEKWEPKGREIGGMEWNYLEVIMVGEVACLAAVEMNSWGALQVFFISFTKGPGGFLYVFLITT